jgi:hypothetical protein
LSSFVVAASRGTFGAMKRALPQLQPTREGLGRPTIMDRALASKHGVPYVHLAVFAIDVDRVRDELDDLDERDALPFAWEVFLTARYLAWRCDPSEDAIRTMLEDATLAVLELPASEEGVLGSQLPFAVWSLVARGLWPKTLESCFRAWKKKPRELDKELAKLFDRAEPLERELAARALTTTMDPPLAPPTRDALTSLAASPDAAPPT